MILARIVAVDPSKLGRIGIAAVSYPAKRPLFLASYPFMPQARDGFASACTGEGGTLVVIEEPLVVSRPGAPRSAKSVVALLVRVGQFVELAERVGLSWRLVKVATWKAARGIPPNMATKPAKERSQKLAAMAVREYAGQRTWTCDPDAADALNLAIYAAGAMSMGRL